MSETLDYREAPPPPHLAGSVRCIWRLRGDRSETPTPEPIVPDGCVEIVLNLGDVFSRHVPAGSVQRQTSRLVAGQITRAVTIEPTGRIDLWGIRFHPWAAPSFLELSGYELRDRFISLDDANPRLDRELAELGDHRSDGAQFNAIVDALSRQTKRASPIDDVLPSLVKLSETSTDGMSVRGIARRAGLSVRRVQAIFRDGVGLAPKQLMRIARFQRALGLARANAKLSWSTVAAQAGYHDQAHLIHESHDIVGCTPSSLLGRDAELTAAFLADATIHTRVTT